jgi:hypothetical protein
MDTVQHFRRHADECRRMARLKKDQADRAFWSLAERCAEISRKHDSSGCKRRSKRNQEDGYRAIGRRDHLR